MNRIKPIDMFLIDALFERENEAGYVLNFSDKTFAEFFARELNIDIDDPVYARNGRGKLKRLRCFLQTVDNPTAVRTLRALWDYRESMRQHFQQPEKVPDGHARLLDLIRRLEGGTPTPPPAPPKPAADAVRIAQLRQELIALPQMAPQPRGYAFEKFLKELFDAYV